MIEKCKYEKVIHLNFFDEVEEPLERAEELLAYNYRLVQC